MSEGARGPASPPAIPGAAPKISMKSTIVGLGAAGPPASVVTSAPPLAKPAQGVKAPAAPLPPKIPLQPAPPKASSAVQAPTRPRAASAPEPSPPASPGAGRVEDPKPVAGGQVQMRPRVATMPESMPALPQQSVQPAPTAPQRPRAASTPESMPDLPPHLPQTPQPAPVMARAEEVRTPSAPAVVKAALAAEPHPAPTPEPARAYAPPPPEAREDPRILVRAAVDEALAPLHRAIQALQARIDELERRPVAPPAAVASPMTATAPMAYAASAYQPAPAVLAPVAAAQAPRVVVRVQPQQVFAHASHQAAIDATAIDVNFEMDGGLDGRRRKRRLILTLVLGIIVVFGGLFGALALSYQPHT